MLRKAFHLGFFLYLLGVSGGFAATNALLYSDDFESYTNGTPLIDTNYWFSSSYEDGSGVFFATVVSNADLAPAGSTNLAAIPIEVTLSNRYATNLPNTWLHTRTKIVTYDGATNVINYDTNAAAAFYFDSNGYCVVRDGTNGWVTVTQTLDGQPAEPVDTNSFITIDLFLDYTNKVWRLNLNSVSITNNIRFINPALTNWGGFTVYNYGLSTTYIDKVSLYALPALSVAPPVLTNTVFYQGTATNQHFQVISRGEGQLNYAVVTNAVSPGWSMTIVSNAVGSLTNAATNAVWIAYDTAALSPGVYTNSFTVMSTNLEGESQTVQVVMNVCRMEVSPSNFSAAALRGYDADSQTIYVSAGGGDMPFSVSTDAGWLSVSPSSGYITGSATNVLTNTYLTSALNPGDYTGRITVAATAGGGDTGTVSVSLRVFSTPVLSAAPGFISQVIDKGANPTGEYFEVWNSSATPRLGMAYHVSVNDPGNIIQGVSPADGVSSGEHYTVGIYFRNVSGYEAGSYTANVAIAATNYGAGYAGHWSGTNNVKVVLLIGAPSAPARVTATEGDYEDRVAVTWTPVVSPTGGEVTYNVLRHTTFDPEYAEVIVSGLTVTNYDDETVSPGLRYYYWVQSVNSHGQAGAKSLYAGGYRRLSAPSGLFASDGLYTNRVVVNWAEVDFATGYRVYRSAGGSPAFAYYTTETEYHDLQAEEGVEYTYYVQSTNSICASTVSAGEKGYILSRPFAISASAGQYVNKVRISWSAVKGASAYELWKSTENIAPPYGGGSKIAETAALAYNDTAVTPGKKYYYWLKSMSATALSAFSARAEGYAATATADLLPWGLVIQPRQIGPGAHPRVVSFRLANRGETALAGDNGTVQMTFYASADNVFGDADDQLLGTVTRKLTLAQNASKIFTLDAGNIVLPSPAGAYYLYMRLNTVWPSTLSPASSGGWVTQRNGTIEVSAAGSINYQAMNDYDGDGISDLAVHGSGLWDVSSADGFELVRGYPFGGAGPSVVMGDYDGDSITDPAVYEESSGMWHGQLSSSGYAYASGVFGGPGFSPVPGDYDGDGVMDLAIYNADNALWYAISVRGRWVIPGLQFGAPGYKPVIGDYDGDGAWDMALYGEYNGLWYVRTVAGTPIVVGEHWGGPGFSPVPGDYDGDGLSDYAVYEAASGRWYIINIYGEMIVPGVFWGLPGYRPVAGDFNGDGAADMAMYNSTSGEWYIRTVSGSDLLLGGTWGGAGRKAIGEVE